MVDAQKIREHAISSWTRPRIPAFPCTAVLCLLSPLSSLLSSLRWCLALATLLGASPLLAQEDPIDFARDVAPIFAGRCLHCHGPDRQDGDLRLDARRFAEMGGHTGTSLLGSGPDNGILQRVITGDAAIRMPKGQPPLPEKEIEAIRRWAEAGSPWESDSGSAFDQFRTVPGITAPSRFAFTWGDLTDWNVWDWPVAKTDRFIAWRNRLIGPLFVILLFAWFCERQRLALLKQQKEETAPPLPAWRVRFAKVPPSVSLCLLLAVLLVFTGAYYQSQTREADALLLARLNEIREMKGVGKVQDPSGEEAPPEPVRLPHPPRLGGVYYRGNDERSPTLFNGGFYRTATMTVELQNAARTTLQWSDAVGSSDLLVHFRVEQSPETAEALFADGIWQETFVTSLVNGDQVSDEAGQLARFEKTSENIWEAWAPISVALDSEEPTTGTLYIQRGKVTDGQLAASPHYGAVYEIQITDGKIAPSSELWMGYTFKTGSVFILPKGRITEDEWFSFRPIPEIEGKQTTDDPGILGVKDYLRDE